MSCGQVFPVCQLMPSFPKVFLFSPSWVDFLSPRPFARWLQVSSPPGLLDDLLKFQVSKGPIHSSSCFFAREFAALQGDQVFGSHYPFFFDRPVPGLLKGSLHLRLEWSNWSSQGARLLDSLGYFKFHLWKEGGVGLPSSQSLQVAGGPERLVPSSD